MSGRVGPVMRCRFRDRPGCVVRVWRAESGGDWPAMYAMEVLLDPVAVGKRRLEWRQQHVTSRLDTGTPKGLAALLDAAHRAAPVLTKPSTRERTA